MTPLELHKIFHQSRYSYLYDHDMYLRVLCAAPAFVLNDRSRLRNVLGLPTVETMRLMRQFYD